MNSFAPPAEALQLVDETVALTTGDLKIADPKTYELAGERLKELSSKEKQIEDFRKKLKAPILAAGKAIDEFFNAPLTRLQGARASLKRSLLQYQIAEEQRRRELEAQAQEAARKEREKLEARAAKAESSGKVEKAQALQMAAASVIQPTIAPTVAKIAGISTRTNYRAEVVDKMELVKAVAAGTVPLNALDANMPFLNNQARAMKETLAYPGVKVVQETGLASRSA